MAFTVGQQVTCVNDASITRLYNEIVPVAGTSYVVRNVVPDPADATKQCIRLNEILNAPKPYKTGIAECSFRADRFVATSALPQSCL